MRTWVKRYLDHRLSRREFMRKLTAAGFSAVAADSIVASLSPPAFGAAPASHLMTPVEGRAGEIFAEQLKAARVKYIFIGNGSGTGPLCDALVDRPDLKPILGVHENHVVSMADGYAKASGQTAFAMFSRVGTPNSTSNMYNAMKDRTPLVLATDHVDTTAEGRDGHEDLDNWLETVTQYTKWRWVVREPARIPEWTIKAFKLASTPPGGPTFLRFPRSVLYQANVKTEIFPAGSFEVPSQIEPNPRQIEEAAKLLVEAKSPILYAGSEIWRSGARAKVVELAELLAIPATQEDWAWTADFPTDHPLFLGRFLAPMRYPRDIDVFLNLGALMPDQESGAPKVPRTAKIIHGGIETGRLGENYPMDLAIVADPGEIAAALTAAVKSMLTPARLAEIRDARYQATKKFTEAMRSARIQAAQAMWDSTPITWERLASDINEMLEKDAYIVPEFGTEGPKALNWFPIADNEKTRIGRTRGRALGWGVGAAIGVKLARPDHQVVALQGDGGFLFGQAEALWSMSRYDVPVIIVIFNNRSYNETRARMFAHGGRQAETGKDQVSYLGDPDVSFVSLAAAFGIRGETVANPGQIKPAMKNAIAAARNGRAYLIDALVGRTGFGAEATWYPKLSVAAMRRRAV